MTHERATNNFLFFRYLFALLVILSHSFELVTGGRATEPLSRLFGTLSFGELAVDGFFLLSGYLIVKSWQADPRPIAFLRKRVVRIYPAFIVAALICLFVIAPLGTSSEEYWRFFDVGRSASEILRLKEPSTPALAFSKHAPSVNGAMWSISYEFKCYLLVLLVGVLDILKKGRGLLASVVVALLCLFLLMNYCVRMNVGPELFGRRPFNNAGNLLMVRMLSMFAVGGLFFVYRTALTYSRTRLLMCCIALVLCLTQAYLAELGLALFGGYLLFTLAFRDVRPLRGFRQLPDASYGLYLYGWPAQLLVMWWAPTLSPLPVFMLTASLALVMGLLSWYGVEKPCLRLNGVR